MEKLNQEVSNYVRRLLENDDSLSTIGNCRNSVSEISRAVGQKYPNITSTILVYPEAKKGLGVHYSLLLTEEQDRKTLINAVAAPGFPEYIGDPKYASPTFTAMKETSDVI